MHTSPSGPARGTAVATNAMLRVERLEVFEGNRITVNPPAAPIKSRTITFRFGGI